MRNTSPAPGGTPPPTIRGCGAGNQPPSPSPADIAKKLEPGLARSPVTPLQEQEPVSGQHPLEKYIGKPTDSTPFNLASVPLALVGLSDSRNGSKLDEINAYAAFGEVINSKKLHHMGQKVLLCGLGLGLGLGSGLVQVRVRVRVR